MTENPEKSKSAWRRQLAQAAKLHNTDERAHASEAICQRLREQPLWKTVKSVLFFWPMPVEPDILPLLREALAEGKIVGLPRFSSTFGHYIGCRIENDSTDVQAGYYGITEPGAACALLELKELDFYLVPGVGFTPDGGRIGRGKGYYDQMLAEVRGIKCGVAFDWQITAGIPLEPHDVRLDCILSPTRWIDLRPGASVVK